MALRPNSNRTISDNRWRQTKRWVGSRRSLITRALCTLALVTGLIAGAFYALDWADGVKEAGRPEVAAPTTPQVRGTSPVEAAKVTGAATERAAGTAAQTNLYSADRAAEATERTGRRTFIVAIGAGLLALASVVFNGLMWRQARVQHQDERTRADRLHVTDMLDKAAGKLSDEDDAARTLAIYTLERVYDDAKLLRGDTKQNPFRRTPTDTLQRAVLETLCAYIRDRSQQDFAKHRAEFLNALGHREATEFRGHPKFDDYRSPTSVRAAVGVLGRCSDLAISPALDLQGSVLADVDFRGKYGDLRLSNGLFGRLSFAGEVTMLSAVDAEFAGDVRFSYFSCHHATFDSSVFHRSALFGPETTWYGDLWLRNAVFSGEAADFSDCRVLGDHQITTATFAVEPLIAEDTFRKDPPPATDVWWATAADD